MKNGQPSEFPIDDPPLTIRAFLQEKGADELSKHYGSPIPSAISLPGTPMSTRVHNHAPRPRPQTLSLLPLVVLVFYGVSGGPFGVEAAVSAGGSFLALVGFLVLPLVWAVPEALVTAELSTAFPEASGFVAWVETAFGPFWGFLEGFMSWISGVTDNSLYPVLFFEYLIAYSPETFSPPLVKYPVMFSVVLALVYLNYRGLEVVGKTAVAICLFSLAPFVVLVFLGLPSVDPGRWFLPPPGGWWEVEWGTFLNLMFWNFNYWDSAAVFAGEVSDPGTTFPKAMGMAVCLVVCAYALPVLIGIGATDTPLADWTDGYFAVVARELGGEWLCGWVVAAAVVSNIGMFQAELSADSFQVMGMAERGMLPSIFMRRSPHGTPTYALLLSTLGILFLCTFDFHAIIEMLNLLYCLAELLEFAAFLKLRVSRPDLHRPYKIPLSTLGCTLLLLPPTMLIFVLLYLASARTWLVCGGMVAAGIFLDFVLQSCRRNKTLFQQTPHASFTNWAEAEEELTPLMVSRQGTVSTHPFDSSLQGSECVLTGKRGRSPIVDPF